MHLTDVEYLICTNRDGTDMEVLDLRTPPPHPVPLKTLKLAERLEVMLR